GRERDEHAAERRWDRARERSRGERRGTQVAGNGNEVGDRNHGGRPNLLPARDSGHLRGHARGGPFPDLRLFDARQNRRRRERSYAHHLRARNRDLWRRQETHLAWTLAWL